MTLTSLTAVLAESILLYVCNAKTLSISLLGLEIRDSLTYVLKPWGSSRDGAGRSSGVVGVDFRELGLEIP